MPWGQKERYGLLPIVETDPQAAGQFHCGKDHLDRYLRECRSAHTSRISHTTVAFHLDYAGIAGYYTLSNDSLKLKTSEVEEYGLSDFGDLASYPAVKIGRLAVAQELQGSGVGRQLLRFIKASIFESQYASACRLLIVDADNDPNVLRFYESNGFEVSLWAEDQARNHAKRGARQATIKMVSDIMVPL